MIKILKPFSFKGNLTFSNVNSLNNLEIVLTKLIEKISLEKQKIGKAYFKRNSLTITSCIKNITVFNRFKSYLFQ